MTTTPNAAPLGGRDRIAAAVGERRHGASFVEAIQLGMRPQGTSTMTLDSPVDEWLAAGRGGLLSIAGCAADSVLVYVVMATVAADRTASTTRMTVQLRGDAPVSPSMTVAHADVAEITGDKALSRGVVTDENGTPIAYASGRIQILPRNVDAELSGIGRPRVERHRLGPGARLVEEPRVAGATPLEYVVPHTADLSNAVGVMHGGAITMLLIEAAARAATVLSPMGDAARATDVDLTFVRPVQLDAADTRLEATLVQGGRRATVVDTVLWSGGNPCALARVGFAAAAAAD